MMNETLLDKVAVVTGASSGIGRACALALADAGAHLSLAARTESALEEVAGSIRALGREALVVPTDVIRREQVSHLVSETLKRWGHVDILVANAGAYVRGWIEHLTVEELERSMAVNFYGAVYAVLEVLPHMLQRKSGHMVLVTSLDALTPIRYDAPYVAAKCALSGFGDVLRQELHGTGVHTTTIFPGRVDTPLIEKLRVPRVTPKIPPEQVARAIVRAIRRRGTHVIVPAHLWPLAHADGLLPRVGDWIKRRFQMEGWEKEGDEK
jgi:NADP-dependent 3-hydroxy acid dehydrogenase YdfG